MKELTIEEKAQAYDKAIERAKNEYQVHKSFNGFQEMLKHIFPELEESREERIRKSLISYLHGLGEFEYSDKKTYHDWLEWLENQSQENMIEALRLEYEKGKTDALQGQRKEWTAEDLLNRNEIVDILQEYNREDLIDWLEKNDKQESIMNVPSREVILAIWDLGNEWKELTNGSISTEHGTQLDYIQKHWEESEYYLRATQDKQKPIIEMKLPEESLGISSEEYNEIVDECLYGESKPTDKVEQSKFNEGDWIMIDKPCQIIRKNDYGNYVVQYCDDEKTHILSRRYCDSHFHLWSIQDVKNGDILVRNHDILSICIFANFDGIDNKFSSFLCYCGLEGEGLGQELSINGYHDNSKNYVPATKEQCELLLQKIREAGYEWDAKKKRLKKICVIDESKVEIDYCFTKMMNGENVSPTWSKMDERILDEIILRCEKYGYQEHIDWLKSLKDRYVWKPNEEQMEALKCAIEDVAKFSKRYGLQVELENEPYYRALHSLYEQLKNFSE